MELNFERERDCPECGVVECRLERIICRDGRTLVGWTCTACGGHVPSPRGGLWISHGAVMAAGVNIPDLPVRVDFREQDADPAPLGGIPGMAPWRAVRVIGRWEPSRGR